jgi:cob(I)alamin adenosyltransferase
VRIERGLVHIYTGDGKGKTTAALGVALRALGWGLKVMMVQFIKGYQNLGEIKFAQEYQANFNIRQFTLDLARDIDSAKVLARQHEAEHAMEYAAEVVMSGDYDVVILDELAVALHYGLIDANRVVKLIEEKPHKVELIITGRGAPEELIQAADYVTEMRLIKHPYDNGVQARAGIDF